MVCGSAPLSCSNLLVQLIKLAVPSADAPVRMLSKHVYSVNLWERVQRGGHHTTTSSSSSSSSSSPRVARALLPRQSL